MEIILTHDNFQAEVLDSNIPVLIDFWAPWCGPCRMLSPIIAQIAEEYEGKIKVCKVNVDDQPELAQAFHVASIPMLAVMKDKALINTSVGYMPKEQVIDLLKLK